MIAGWYRDRLFRKDFRSDRRHDIQGVTTGHADRNTRGHSPTAAIGHPGRRRHHTDRSSAMHLLVEELSRERMRQAQREFEAIRLARRLRSSRKQRRSAGIV